MAARADDGKGRHETILQENLPTSPQTSFIHLFLDRSCDSSDEIDRKLFGNL